MEENVFIAVTLKEEPSWFWDVVMSGGARELRILSHFARGSGGTG